jgi:ABC-2 type transport system permease protein
VWLLLATAVVTVAVGAAAAATYRCPPEGCTLDPTKISLTGVDVGQAIVAVFAVLTVSGEYSSGLIRLTLAAMPRRATVLAAKAATLTGLVLAASTIAVLGSLLAGRLLLPGHGTALSLANGPVLRAAVGSVLYLALVGLIALGVAMAVRDSATAIGVVLGLLYVLPIFTQVVSDQHWQRRLQQIGPMSAGLAVQTTTELHKLPIGPWAGLGVLAGWACVALLTGGLLLHLRDA